MDAVQPRRRSLLHAFDARAERLAMHATRFAGGTRALAIAVAAVVVWLLLGPLFRYSEGWQLAINSATTIVTFLMVFVLQRSQN